MPVKMCGNEKCIQLVPESINSGVTRKYCSYRCGQAAASRRYRARNNGQTGEGLIHVVDGRPWLKRTMAPTSAAAEARFRKHLKGCAAYNGDPCPARLDPYDRKRECLIHAVLREDWDQLRRAENGVIWKRVMTSEQGQWIEKPIGVTLLDEETGDDHDRTESEVSAAEGSG